MVKPPRALVHGAFNHTFFTVVDFNCKAGKRQVAPLIVGNESASRAMAMISQ